MMWMFGSITDNTQLANTFFFFQPQFIVPHKWVGITLLYLAADHATGQGK